MLHRPWDYIQNVINKINVWLLNIKISDILNPKYENFSK